ncbi:unnamed protein product, partial [Laminaria digitata]
GSQSPLPGSGAPLPLPNLLETPLTGAELRTGRTWGHEVVAAPEAGEVELPPYDSRLCSTATERAAFTERCPQACPPLNPREMTTGTGMGFTHTEALALAAPAQAA